MMNKILKLSKTKTQCTCSIREYNVFATNEDSTVIIGIVNRYSTPKSIIFNDILYNESYNYDNTKFEIFRNYINDESVKESVESCLQTTNVEPKRHHVIGITYVKEGCLSWRQKHNNFKIIDSGQVTQKSE